MAGRFSLLHAPTTEEFYNHSEQIKNTLLDLYNNTFGNGSMSEETKWAEHVFSNNVTNKSAHKSGMMVPAGVQSLVEATTEQKDKMQYAYVLGWIVEMVNSWFEIADDVINKAELRKSARPSTTSMDIPWHKNPGIGMTAINDCFMLQAMAYNTVYYFVGQKHPIMADDLSDAMRDTYRARYTGVAFEEGLKKNNNLRDTHTITNYRQMVLFKYAIPFFVTPLRYALIIGGKQQDSQLMNQVDEIMIEIGYLVKLRVEWNELFNDNGNFDQHLSQMSWFSVSAVEMLSSVEDTKLIDELQGALLRKEKPLLQEIFRKAGLEEKYKEQESIIYNNVVQKAKDLKFKIKEEFFIEVLQHF